MMQGNQDLLKIPPMKPIHTPPEGLTSINLLGIPTIVRLHGRDTGGALSIIELCDKPGGGAPMHIHEREDETFHVIEGEYEFTCGGETFIAKPGATVFGPRGIAHGYRYLGDTPGKLLLVVTPSGIEDWFAEVGELEEQTVPAVVELGKKYGLEFLPPD